MPSPPDPTRLTSSASSGRPSIAANMRLGIDMGIQKAKEILHVEQRKEEDARYPAQRDERGIGRDLD